MRQHLYVIVSFELSLITEFYSTFETTSYKTVNHNHMKKFTILNLMLVAGIAAIAQPTTNPAPYCDASFDDMQGFPVDDHINSVSFGTLNNVSNAQFAPPHYVFYNNINTASFTKGSTYTLSVNFTTAGGCGYGVWIDYNHNNAFEANEKIAGTAAAFDFLQVGGTPTITQQVTIPNSAVTGNTRMRVRIVEDDLYHSTTTDELPCNASNTSDDVMDWGETEDYTINITTTNDLLDNQVAENIQLFPSPSSGIMHVNSNMQEPATLTIYAAHGQVVYTKQNITGNQTIDLSALAKGMYYAKIVSQKISSAIKPIILE